MTVRDVLSLNGEASTHFSREVLNAIYSGVEVYGLSIDVQLIVTVVALLCDVLMILLFDLCDLEISSTKGLVELIV